jgi:peptidoglycan hydrolase-like protein with peptidoglycan-binding domain
MVALYQAAMNLIEDGTDTLVDVDGKFGPKTHEGLKAIQRFLKVAPADGLPGPKTTVALIEALTKSPVPIKVAFPAPAPAAKPVTNPSTVVNKPVSVPVTPASAASVTPAPVSVPATPVRPKPAPVAAPAVAPAPAVKSTSLPQK